MPDVIIISENRKPESDSCAPATFSVRYARFRSDEHLAPLLTGKAVPQINAHSVLEHGSLDAPDGTPMSLAEIGRPAIQSLEEAVNVARASLQNPKSEPVKKGFTTDAPIYVFRKGQAAERVA